MHEPRLTNLGGPSGGQFLKSRLAKSTGGGQDQRWVTNGEATSYNINIIVYFRTDAPFILQRLRVGPTNNGEKEGQFTPSIRFANVSHQ